MTLDAGELTAGELERGRGDLWMGTRDVGVSTVLEIRIRFSLDNVAGPTFSLFDSDTVSWHIFFFCDSHADAERLRGSAFERVTAAFSVLGDCADKGEETQGGVHAAESRSTNRNLDCV